MQVKQKKKNRLQKLQSIRNKTLDQNIQSVRANQMRAAVTYDNGMIFRRVR